VVANATDYPGVAAFSTVLPAAGYRNYNNGSLNNQGTYAQYLSSTTRSSTYVHSLFFGSQSVAPSYYTGGRYGYGYAVRCIIPSPTVTVSPTSATFVAAGETKTFTVTTTDVLGTPTVTAIDDTTGEAAAWISSATVSGTTLTVTTVANSSTTTPRTATLTIAAGSTTATVTITQERLTGGVLASPGVIGYIKGTNTLTLRGSKEYSANTDVANYALTIDPEGLEDETVYVAIFQFGSLIAFSSDPSGIKNQYPESDDYIVGPMEYTGWDALKANHDWLDTPVFDSEEDWNYQDVDGNYTKRDVSHPDYHNSTNFALGKGDPCMYYFGSDGWKLPTGDPYNGYGYTYYNDFSPVYSVTNMTWKDEGALGTGLPAGVLSGEDGETGWFYPAAGYRNSPGDMYSDRNGNYWASTARNNVVQNVGNSLYFDSSEIWFDDYIGYIWGYAIRCVRN
jgi:hypothetical protein